MATLGHYTILDTDDQSAGLEISLWQTLHTYTLSAPADIFFDVEVGDTSLPLAGDGQLDLAIYKNDRLVSVHEEEIADTMVVRQCVPLLSFTTGDVVDLKIHSDDSNALNVAVISRLCRYNLPYTLECRGRHGRLRSLLRHERGRHRSADLAQNTYTYNLYVGEDAMPDFTAAPWDTWTDALAFADHDIDPALPAADPGSTVTYYVALRRRNRFGLETQNQSDQVGAIYTITLDENGDRVATKPRAPDFQAQAAAADGTIRVTAQYHYLADAEADRADTWVYWLKGGSAPDPDVDPATGTSAMRLADGVGKLTCTSGAFADGTTVHVLVRTRNSGSPNLDSVNTAAVTATAETDAPAAPDHGAALFGETMGEQQ